MTEPSGPTTQALIATHQLKSWPQYYGPVVQGRKTFEIRKNDRNYAVGDCLILCEWNPATQQFSGQQVAVRVTYLTDFDQQPGYVVMSIQLMYPAADALRSLPAKKSPCSVCGWDDEHAPNCEAFGSNYSHQKAAEAEVARLTPDVYPAVLDALDKHCRGFVFKPITRENIGALVDAICATHEREVQQRQAAESAVARLTQARDTLRTALQYVESVYRLNCVAEGEPSSVLEELQRVIKLTAGAEAGPLPAPRQDTTP